MNLTSTGYDPAYHDRQFSKPYESTVRMYDWLEGAGAFGERSRICDLGCGKGASLIYAAQRFSDCTFVGIDIDGDTIVAGKEHLSSLNLANCSMRTGDIFSVAEQFPRNEFDGLVSLQTLSWLPGYERAIDAMAALDPEWIAVSSLFYDGPVASRATIEMFDTEGKATELHYNTYSLPMFRDYLARFGFTDFRALPFDIQIDLPRPDEPKMQTYTERLEDGRRLQISGPILMNWHFVYARKDRP